MSRNLATIILIYGLLLGIVCSVWTWVMWFTGWYKDLAFSNFGAILIPLLFVGVGAGLWKTANLRQRYFRQALTGAALAAVAGLVFGINSILLAGVVDPTFLPQQHELHQASLRKWGFTEEEIATRVAAQPIETTTEHGVGSFFVAVKVGGVASILLSIFIRSRRQRRETAG